MKMLPPIRVAILLIALFSVFMSCKKQRIERKYTGDFEFTVQDHSWNNSSGDFDTTYTYSGRIIISNQVPAGLSSKGIFLKIFYYSPTDFALTAVDNKGEFSFPGDGGFNGTDEVDFVFESRGHTSYYKHVVHGVRR